MLTDEGRGPSAWRHGDSPIAARLRYRSHRTTADGVWSVLETRGRGPADRARRDDGLRTTPGLGVLRAETTVRNDGAGPVTLESVASFILGGPLAADCDVHWADNDWLAEGRWRQRPARAGCPT